MKKAHIYIGVIAVEALVIVMFYFYARIQNIEANKQLLEALRVKDQLESTQKQLDQAKKELENCR
jgi:hypothetical protein